MHCNTNGLKHVIFHPTFNFSYYCFFFFISSAFRLQLRKCNFEIVEPEILRCKIFDQLQPGKENNCEQAERVKISQRSISNTATFVSILFFCFFLVFILPLWGRLMMNLDWIFPYELLTECISISTKKYNTTRLS